jgi:hypothetical protein
MTIKYIQIFQSEALKFFPILAFWFENKPSGNPATNHNSQEREKHDPGLSLKKAVDGSTG